MSLGKTLAQELNYEAVSTRAMLERLPESDYGWAPHEKSMTLGALAAHVAESGCWTEQILNQDEFDLDPANYKPLVVKGRDELLKSFDGATAKACAQLEQAEDACLMALWKFKSKGNLVFEMPRIAVVRMFILSHLIHHRGQLSVYMRLRDIPVPSIYGPTADAPM